MTSALSRLTRGDCEVNWANDGKEGRFFGLSLVTSGRVEEDGVVKLINDGKDGRFLGISLIEAVRLRI